MVKEGMCCGERYANDHAGKGQMLKLTCDISALIFFLTIDYFLRPVGAKFSIQKSETQAFPKS